MNLNDAQSLAYQLMRQHGLWPAWSFEFDNSVRRFGVCSHHRKLIGLSKPLTLLNDVSEVRDTILHEIAHALVNGKHGHDNVWKAKCREIGARPVRCYSKETTEIVKGRYQATCVCGLIHYRHKKSEVTCACKCQVNKPWSQRHILKYIDTKMKIFI